MSTPSSAPGLSGPLLSPRWGRNPTVLGLLALTIVAALMRFSTLDMQSYWYDEAITVELIRKPLHTMLLTLPHTESTPPLYYLFAWIWSRMFGTSEAGLRSLSAVIGTATVPATYIAARSFVAQRAALAAAALIAVSPLLVWYSQEARAYALLVLLGAVSLVPLRPATAPHASNWIAAWAIAAILALATHYFALFLVAAEAVWLLRRAAEKRATAIAVTAVVIAGVALAPLAIYQARYSQHTAWIANSGGIGGRLAYLVHQLVVGSYPAAHIRPIIAAVPVLVLVGLFTWTERDERAATLVVLGFAFAAIAPPAALAMIGDRFFGGRGDYFFYRNVIVATVPLTIAAAAVIAGRRTGKLGTAAVVVSCILMVGVVVEIARRPDLQRPDVRAVAAALGVGHMPRAIVADKRTAAVLRLYLPHAVDTAETGARIQEVDLILEPGVSIAASPPRGFRRFTTRSIDTFRIVLLRARRPLSVRLAKLRLSLATSGGDAVLIARPQRYSRSSVEPKRGGR